MHHIELGCGTVRNVLKTNDEYILFVTFNELGVRKFSHCNFGRLFLEVVGFSRNDMLLKILIKSLIKKNDVGTAKKIQQKYSIFTDNEFNSIREEIFGAQAKELLNMIEKHLDKFEFDVALKIYEKSKHLMEESLFQALYEKYKTIVALKKILSQYKFQEADELLLAHNSRNKDLQIDSIFYSKLCEISKEKFNLHVKKEQMARKIVEENENRRNIFKQLNIPNLFKNKFIRADSIFDNEMKKSGLREDEVQILRKEYEELKRTYIKQWIENNILSRKKGENYLPDDEQVASITAVNGHVQVVARAGSGKTTTLVNRTLFLLKHCGVAPSEMLLLAFNRKAAFEIRRKLLGSLNDGAEAAVATEVDHRIRELGKNKRIDRGEIDASAVDTVAKKLNIILPHVMTFHALTYAIVHPEESLLYNDAESKSQGLSRVFQQLIDDHLQIPSFKEEIRELMLAHFREDWDRIVEGCYNKSKEELLQFRRSLLHESLGGEYVKSFGEKVIADFLFEHDIAYKYERNHWWSGINYHPDFTIFRTPTSGVIIEYFGLNGDTDYDKMSTEKRAYWNSKKDWMLLAFTPRSIVGGGVDLFHSLLKERLEEQGIPCVRLSEDEIWYRVRDRAIDRFTTAMVGFIGRCRKQSLSPSELCNLIEGSSPLSSVESMFLNIANRLYKAYLERLSATGEEDFDGLMQRAADRIGSGQTLFERKSGKGDLALLRYICIDEFQDFSDLFYRLINAIRKQNPRIELFCVGDDWQAINGFSGSDLRFFENFTEYIGESRRLYISTNYRSSNAIVNIGNELMDGLGKSAIAHKKSDGEVIVTDLNEFEPSLLEKQRHPGDIITPTVLRLTSKALVDGHDVVMLCRRNSIPWFVNYQDQVGGDGRGIARYLDLIQSFFAKGLKERISISTAHKYKGLEKSVVIVLDAVARSYPLIHPDWAFYRVLGDNPKKITEEERRLFYVALTRAVEKLVIITDGRSKSPFIRQLERGDFMSPINWADYPPILGSTSRIVVKVGNQNSRNVTPTFAIKDLLKATGYQWQSTTWPGWVKSFPTDGFNIETLKAELWAKSVDAIEVRIFDGGDKLAGRYLINMGQWICDFDNLV